MKQLALYANVGPELTHFDVDVDAATLTRRGSVTLPRMYNTLGRMHRSPFSTSRAATVRPAWGRLATRIMSLHFASARMVR